MMSLISALSKKLWPPEIVYGMRSLRSACSITRAWWLPRYRIAKSDHLFLRWKWSAEIMIAIWSASVSSFGIPSTLMGSPSPCSDHSDFSNSFGLLPMTALAACRMRVVER